VATAQLETAYIPPSVPRTHINGIDVTTLDFTYEHDDISVGEGEDKITLKRIYNTPDRYDENISIRPFPFGKGTTYNYNATFSDAGASAIAVWANGESALVNCKVIGYSGINDCHLRGGRYENAGPENGNGTWIYENHDGARYLADNAFYISYIEYPDGRFINIYYDNINGRIDKIINSEGYGIQIKYMISGQASSDYREFLITEVDAFRQGCVNGLEKCSSGNLGKVTYGYLAKQGNSGLNNDFLLSSFTDENGKTTTYRYDDSGYELMQSEYLPDNGGQPSFINSYIFNRTDGSDWSIQQVDAAGHTLKFSLYDNYPGESQYYVTTIIKDDGSSIRYNFLGYPDGTNLVASTVDEIGRTTSYTYSYGRVTTRTDPSGLLTTWTLDERDNVTQKRVHSPNGEADIVYNATYPSCTDANYKICNKPTTTIDANGNQTDYQYDPSNGGVIATLSPAAAGHGRILTKYTYGFFSPTIPALTFPAVTTSTGAYLLTQRDTCDSGLTGTTVNFSVQCAAGSSTTQQYLYRPSTPTSPTSYRLAGTVVDPGGLALRTCYLWDQVGNRIAATKPNGTGASCF